MKNIIKTAEKQSEGKSAKSFIYSLNMLLEDAKAESKKGSKIA